jgi:DNA-binding MarR family transcriptional regulator
MTYLLDDLESAGLIERHPDPADRRARQVVATPLGIELLADLDDRLRSAEAHLLAPLGDKAGETFRSQIRLLATRIGVSDPPDNPCKLAEQGNAELPIRRTPARPNVS